MTLDTEFKKGGGGGGRKTGSIWRNSIDGKTIIKLT
jgi:hypothetical protein